MYLLREKSAWLLPLGALANSSQEISIWALTSQGAQAVGSETLLKTLLACPTGYAAPEEVSTACEVVVPNLHPCILKCMQWCLVQAPPAVTHNAVGTAQQ